MPNPTEGNPPPFLKGEGDDARSACRSTPDPEQARARARVQGHHRSVRRQARRVPRASGHGAHGQRSSSSATARKPFKVGAPVHAAGQGARRGRRRRFRATSAPSPRSTSSHFDAVLHDSHDEDHIHLKPLDFPPPMYGLAIEPKRRGDEQRIADALHKLIDEDPCAARRAHHAASTRRCSTAWASCTCACCSSA